MMSHHVVIQEARMLILGLIMVILALAGGSLMLWKIPLPGKYKSLGNLPLDLRLSVIIPARNEAKRLPPLLASLREQDFFPIEVIVVDDDSRDETASVARQGLARVIAAADYGTEADGADWAGKSRACWAGAHAACGDILLFLDADTRLDHADSLRRLLLTYRKQESQGILSVQPYHRIKRFYENFSAVFNIIVLAGVNIFTPWGGRFKSAGAFGPCLMCRKDEYMAVGGHAAIRGAILDDLALGNLFMQAALPVSGYGGRGLIHFRMYPQGFAQLFEGWTKNFASGATRTHPWLMVMIVFWIGGSYSSVAVLIWSIQKGGTAWIIIASLLCLSYMLQMFWLARRAGHFYPLSLVFYPILHIFFTGLFAWSMFRTKILHSVRWRGRLFKV
jgi:4,4'-diaponeurosporenoate glycosyltransferase